MACWFKYHKQILSPGKRQSIFGSTLDCNLKFIKEFTPNFKKRNLKPEAKEKIFKGLHEAIRDLIGKDYKDYEDKIWNIINMRIINANKEI